MVMQDQSNSKRLVSNLQILSIPLNELHQHPQMEVSILVDDYLQKLVKDIRKNGIANRITVFPDPDGGYWIISGYHLVEAAKLAGYTEADCILNRSMTKEIAEKTIAAALCTKESSITREAFALRKKWEAESHQGYRSDLHGDIGRSRVEILSERTRQRYIRLTYLIPFLRDQVDNRWLRIRTGEALSYLSESMQQVVAENIKKYNLVPTMKIAEEWKALSKKGSLLEAQILDYFIQHNNFK